MNAVLKLLRSGWVIAFIGIVLLSVLVWFGGPYLGFGTHQPLASAVARLLFILFIVVVWAVSFQIKYLRTQSKTKQMAADMVGQTASPTANDQDQRIRAEQAQLQVRFAQAVDTLRKRRNKGQNLYSLPWYVVLGPPGSGKTTLLQNSGLHFPLAERFGKDALRGVGGTRNCDWWFTDEAVFLDTAGRYTTQDSDEAADGSAWIAFLHLLRRYRKRRPINGVIIALSMSDLLLFDDVDRRAHIAAIRKRLEELSEHLRIGVPAYLVLTKCDLIAGFTEFFEDLSPELRDQVWGFTFPAPKTIDGSAWKGFDEEFSALLDRLSTRVLRRLHGERDPGRRAVILSFPQQLSTLQSVAREVVEGIFSPHQYGAVPLLRGVYLTSGAQEGAPIDRMMSAIARTFGVDVAQVQNPTAQQRTFFVRRLLKDVIFAESGFAGANPILERRKAALQLLSYAAVVGVTGLLLAGLVISYARNTAYLKSVQAALVGFPVKNDVDGATTQRGYFERVLDRMSAYSSVQEAVTQYKDHVPLLMRFGLYQGDQMEAEAQSAYVRELNGLLLPGVASQFKLGIESSGENPQRLYYYLKGYLMLAEPNHLNVGEVVTLSDILWRQLFPNEPVFRKALAKDLYALVAVPGRLHPLSADATLVGQARSTLRAANLTTLVYSSMKLETKSGPYSPLAVGSQLGLLGNVFMNKNGTPLDTVIPALYTQPVFQYEVSKGIEKTVEQFTKDHWVYGARQLTSAQKADLASRVLQLYQHDYIQVWSALIDSVELVPTGNLLDASDVAAKLSGAGSPLKALLLLVQSNTSNMLRKPPNTKKTKSLMALKQEAAQAAMRRALARALASGGTAGAVAAKPGAAIAAYFKAINALSVGAPGSKPIDQILGELKQLSQTLLAMADGPVAPSGGPNMQLQLIRQQVSQLPPPVSMWLSTLTDNAQSLLTIGADGALQQQYEKAAGSACAAVISGRYPFSSTSPRGVPLQNFADLFGRGGRFDSFYQGTLKKLINTTGPTWRWKEGPGAIHGYPGLLSEMQMAEQIRRMYFHHGSMPRVQFTLINPVLGQGVGKLVVDIGGQSFVYKPGGVTTSHVMWWPGPQPGFVSIAVYGKSGFIEGRSLIGRLDYQGDWAFFRALQAAQLSRQSDLSFLARFNVHGHSVLLTVRADNLTNPFLNTVVSRFRCEG